MDAVRAAMYNSVFGIIVSVDEGGTVCVWNLSNGSRCVHADVHLLYAWTAAALHAAHGCIGPLLQHSLDTAHPHPSLISRHSSQTSHCQ